jgi:WD40 repeat protein
VFEAETSRLLCQCEVFHGQVIHGIVLREVVAQENDFQIVIWGGSCLALLKKTDFLQLLDQDVSCITNNTISASDWILDAALSSYDNNCVLVTAHNTVLLATLDEDVKSTCLQSLPSPSRSILYSAHLIWKSSAHVLVAAGTVFGEIVVWQCSTSREKAFSGSRVLFTFAGHEGSIFGVNISPPITEPNGNVNRLLASCSDDRTIRVWNISEKSNQDQTCDRATHQTTSPRETGFGNNGENIRATQTYSQCLATAMGHASRIWRVKFLVYKSIALRRPAVSVLSFGEDSTTQHWELDFPDVSQISPRAYGNIMEIGSYSSARLTRINAFALHSGKHIWSTAIYQVSDARSILATGGADGKISIYNIPQGSSEEPLARCPAQSLEEASSNEMDERSWCDLQSRSWDIDDVLKECQPNPSGRDTVLLESPNEDSATASFIQPPDGESTKKKIKKPSKDAFNRYAFVSERQMLITTTFGRVFLGHIDVPVKWYELLLPQSGMHDLRSYAILEGIPEIGLAFLAGVNGNIYVYRTGSMLLEVGNVNGKIADMFTVLDREGDSYALLVTTLAGKVATLFHICLPITDSPSFSEMVTYQIPEKFIVTSASRSGNLLLLGSRTGSLAVYNPKSNNRLSVWEPDYSDAGDAITAIVPLPADSHGSSIHFLTTGRNGSYSIFASKVTRDANMVILEATVYPVHHGLPPFGPMIEAGWFEGGDLFLYGFRSKNFVVWNETQKNEVMNVACGGAHRSYAYSAPQATNCISHFAYTKASRLCLISQPGSSHKIIKPGGHGREIKACSVSKDNGLVATGAEDTAIRIWRYENCDSPLHKRFKCLAIIQKHTAGIQHLEWYKSEYLFSSGGNEEFFVWAIQPIPNFDIGVVCEASCPDQSEDRDLRIMSFAVTELRNSPSPSLESKLLISLAYSDSTIRSYTYSKARGFVLVASGRYTSSCLTQICHVQVLNDEIFLLTAATDGKLTLWKSTISMSSTTGVPDHSHVPQLFMLSNRKVHQSAIKSLDVAAIRPEKDIVIVTGGDDNALAVSIYRIRESLKEGSASSSVVLRSAHAASITGLSILPGPGGADPSLSIISSSNDQRVKVWDVRIDNEDQTREDGCHVEIMKVGDTFTSVADVGDLAVFSTPRNCEGRSSKNVLIVGNGMEIWNVSCKT